MYCKNCGNKMDPRAAFCVKCGLRTGDGVAYCSNCGATMPAGAAACTSCGAVPAAIPLNTQKSRIAAGLLGILIGGLGIHNFYLGYTGKAVAQLLLTLLSCGLLAPISSIWGLIDGIMILINQINEDANGIPLKE